MIFCWYNKVVKFAIFDNEIKIYLICENCKIRKIRNLVIKYKNIMFEIKLARVENYIFWINKFWKNKIEIENKQFC